MPNSTGLVDKNPANKTNGRHIHNYSTFDRSLSYRLYNTHRFGDYVPTFVMDGVPTDEVSLNSKDSIDSLSLKAPFKGSIRKIKESFMVPNMAILPMQWDRIYAQNSNGDDVPSDANCVLQNFPQNFKTLWTSVFSAVMALPRTSTAERVTFLTGLIRALVLGEYVYSAGCLMHVLGYKATTQWSIDMFDPNESRLNQYDFDWWFDQVIYEVFGSFINITVVEPVGSQNVTHRFYGLSTGSDANFGGYQSFRELLELFRENPMCYVTGFSVSRTTTESAWNSNINALHQSYNLLDDTHIYIHTPDVNYIGDVQDETSLNPNVLNLSRLLGYQLIVSHFYTNSSIDFIYSAELYRQYIYHLFIRAFGIPTAASAFTFSWNGLRLEYDYLSGHILNRALALTGSYLTNFLSSFTSNTGAYLVPLAVYSAVFGFRKSLRYGDYFTASRPRPLAPINTDVSVNNNIVSVIDITRRIQAQRFGNAVMRTRSKIEEYVKSFFGRAPQPDFHNPFFLIRQEEIIFGDQVQNTGSAQTSVANSRTANFAGYLDRHTFTFHNDDAHPCIYYQIVSYDTPRAYTRSVERQFLHIDRFDMFNPDFQYIGDQPIYGIELGYYDVALSNSNIPDVFAYTTRDMEYKQRYDQASGGFASGALPGWSFTDKKLNNNVFNNLSPDFIRSRNSDIDYLFLSLTGYSLGNYFHFNCVTDNNVSAKRPMAVDPQILG